ncbi:hypothetical protein Q5762_07385 [Streptomyces sp. P9(2023)]|uniref:hypothetical protein n=1 Tax=Streptomyces sp. P9(2023) TaxID=3064394 RepID=UPI0028F40310|nr:hypothetical protein [Streptomyces sp. P9(2023)]MDT9688179.1 hypothetical protein [Streptomyces sp. P9(2023)]
MTPTLGAVFIGFAFLVWELSVWFPGTKALQTNGIAYLGDLLPFLICWCIGALTAMVVGGLVGWIGDTALWGLNTFGDGLLVYGVGAKAGTAPGSTAAPLTEGGLFMTGLVLAGFLARRRKGSTGSKWRGWGAGVGLGLSAGIARYAAVPLASAVNASGIWFTGIVA